MLCRLSFAAKGPVVLPFDYNHILQAVVYSFVGDQSYAKFMHDSGYAFEKRNYKMFSFSGILQRPIRVDRQRKEFTFDSNFSFCVSSIENEFFNYVFNSIISVGEEVRFGRNSAQITGIELLDRRTVSGGKGQAVSEKVEDRQETALVVRTLSPITVYSTLYTAEGKHKTYYYQASETQFGQMLRDNLIRKYKALNEKEPVYSEFDVRTLGRARERIITYKGFIIKGQEGRFQLRGSKELVDLALCAGLGSKNSMGFGCLEPLAPVGGETRTDQVGEDEKEVRGIGYSGNYEELRREQ